MKKLILDIPMGSTHIGTMSSQGLASKSEHVRGWEFFIVLWNTICQNMGHKKRTLPTRLLT